VALIAPSSKLGAKDGKDPFSAKFHVILSHVGFERMVDARTYRTIIGEDGASVKPSPVRQGVGLSTETLLGPEQRPCTQNSTGFLFGGEAG
jgi:hypothetical protein